MSINSIGGSGYNPYARPVGGANPPIAPNAARPATAQTESAVTPPAASPKGLADAIKHDADARAAQVNSPNAPDGVDQDLWSVLTKDERNFFVKAGAMGPLTYGRFTPAQTAAPAPIVRGGRLDIKA
jgi:hypothetical protein